MRTNIKMRVTREELNKINLKLQKCISLEEHNLRMETVLKEKLKKKNELLKKARIKRKNQREELNKINLKLQKCISLEEHNSKMKNISNEAVFKVEEKQVEIQKLKAIIEYLEGKIK